MKNIYLILGKSGSGKTTIVQEACKKFGYVEVLSYTERPKRSENEQGHIFVSKEEFSQLEDLCAYTVFNGNRYGVPASTIEKSDLYVIDIAGIEYMKTHYSGSKNIVVIGICCSEDPVKDVAIRTQRMSKRGDNDEDVISRVLHDERAFKEFENIIDYKIVNNSVEESVNKLHTIITNLENQEG